MTIKAIPLSPKVAERFAALRDALSAAAQPFTKSDAFAVSPLVLYELPEASVEADALLKQHAEPNVSHSFVLTSPGQYAHELRW